jgi:hypothetical protein
MKRSRLAKFDLVPRAKRGRIKCKPATGSPLVDDVGHVTRTGIGVRLRLTLRTGAHPAKQAHSPKDSFASIEKCEP